MRIDPEAYLTPSDAEKALGLSHKALYRTTKRAEDAGHVVRIELFGKRVYLARMISVLKKFHYAQKDKSPEAMARRRAWGEKGMAIRWGEQKKAKKPRARGRAS